MAWGTPSTWNPYMELGTGQQAQNSLLGPFGRGGGTDYRGVTSGAGNFGMYKFPNRPAPAPAAQPTAAQPQPQQQAPQQAIQPQPPPQWADPTSTAGAVANPFALDNPFGSGGAFTNFYESHPGLAGVSNFQDIRAQAPNIAAGGQFENPYGTMRQFSPGQQMGAPLSGGYGTGPTMQGPSTYGIGRSNR